MALSTITKMRAISGYTEDDIGDAVITDRGLVADADRAVLNIATVFVYNEKLSGIVDGTNTLFRTKNRPIADADASGTVDGSDVSIYLVDYDTGADRHPTYTSAAVTSITSRTGVITLTTAPTTDNTEAGVYGDYRYIKGSLTAEHLQLSANYYLAYLCACAIQGRLPLTFSVGGITRREGMAGAIFYHRAIDVLSEGGYLEPLQTAVAPESERSP